jgi:hypothetical protein
LQFLAHLLRRDRVVARNESGRGGLLRIRDHEACGYCQQHTADYPYDESIHCSLSFVVDDDRRAEESGVRLSQN